MEREGAFIKFYPDFNFNLRELLGIKSPAVLFSGGIDSTTLAYFVLLNFPNTTTLISINREERPKGEILAARRLIEIFKKEFPGVMVRELFLSSDVETFENYIQAVKHSLNECDRKPDGLIIGVIKPDWFYHPEDLPNPFDLNERLERMAGLPVFTPFAYLSKEDVISYASKLGILHLLRDYSYSCCYDSEKNCACVGCKERKEIDSFLQIESLFIE